MRFVLIEAFGVTETADPAHATGTSQAGHLWCNTSAIAEGASPTNAVAQFLGVPEAHLTASPFGPAASLVTRHTGGVASGHESVYVLVVPLDAASANSGAGAESEILISPAQG